MDTLIDNRNFPPEMQDIPQKTKGPQIPALPFILIFLGIIILGFLIYLIFIKNAEPKILTEPAPLKVEQVKENLALIHENTPDITPQERNERVSAFFN